MIASAPFMSCREDRSISETVVDSMQFAREAGVLAGSVPVAQLGRLADLLADASGALVCELRGGRDGEGKSYLDLKVGGSVNLRCQRCLGALPFAVAIDSRLMLVASEEDWTDEELAEDGPDAIEASRELAVLPLVEDEILLALPIAPRHENCRPPGETGEAETEHRPSPFAALAKLKDH